MKTFKTPGVYVEEIPNIPPSVAQAETAIPAFIGYTEKAKKTVDNDLLFVTHRIESIVEFEKYFGRANPESCEIELVEHTDESRFELTINRVPSGIFFRMYYALRMYYANGGGPCYIISVGDYASIGISKGDVKTPAGLLGGLTVLEKEDEPTIIVIPDAVELTSNEYKEIYEAALTQCKNLQDRVTILDLYDDTGDIINDALNFRNSISLGSEYLKYGAAYYPRLKTVLNFPYDESKVTIKTHLDQNGNPPVQDLTGKALDSVEIKNNKSDLYNQLIQKLKNSDEMQIVLPPSSAVAGIYARIDNTQGVWKAPANVPINNVIKPTVAISNKGQDYLNVDITDGKSINTIRSFIGKGTLVWGARTLAGNDNEWRYISVRRFFNMVEESCKKATAAFIFEPNDTNTWTKIRAMLENFLTTLWRQGALQGAKPEHAFYVKCGLGETMTTQDILNGFLIVEIGMAQIRPAEFIVLRFSHKMQES